jgi:multidrug efflux pump subunit AcrA (membrane-fusion protein)
VITTIPAADRQKATVLVRIGFDELDPRILPDMGVKVAFLEAPPAEAPSRSVKLFVPRSALRSDGEQQVVFVVANGKVERRAVNVGPESGGGRGGVEILAGLTAGERVVVEGPADLAHGDEIRSR